MNIKKTEISLIVLIIEKKKILISVIQIAFYNYLTINQMSTKIKGRIKKII